MQDLALYFKTRELAGAKRCYWNFAGNHTALLNFWNDGHIRIPFEEVEVLAWRL